VAEEIAEIEAGERQRRAQDEVFASLSAEQLEDMLKGMFEAADTDGSGMLDMKELRDVLVQVPVELSDAELNYMLYQLDVDDDGKLSMEEFLPMAFQLLVETVAQLRDFDEGIAAADQAVEEEEIVEAMAEDICETTGMSMEELQGILEEVFLQHDVDGNGVLDQAEFVRCITEIGTKLELDKRLGGEIFRAVDANGDGLVEWKEFVTPAVSIIHASLSEAVAEEIAEIETQKRQLAEESVLSTLSPEELKDMLKGMFEAADTDGSGMLDMKEVRVALSQVPVELSDSELNYMLYQLDVDDDGKLSCKEFLPMAYELLVAAVAQMRDF